MTDGQTLGPIYRTPGIPGSDKNWSIGHFLPKIYSLFPRILLRQEIIQYPHLLRSSGLTHSVSDIISSASCGQEIVFVCETTAQGCDDTGAAPGGRPDWPAVLGDENHSGLCCRDICRCLHQGRWENFFYQEGG